MRIWKNQLRQIICCRKIIRYLNDIKECFEQFNIKDYQDLEKTKFAHYAITQLITILNSLKENLQIDTVLQMNAFCHINLKEARNDASHAYNRVNFERFCELCLDLTKDEIYEELRLVIKAVNQWKILILKL